LGFLIRRWKKRFGRRRCCANLRRVSLDFLGVPDETTILKFRHFLEKHELSKAMFDEITAVLTELGLLLRQGTIVDATLIAAPPSTKKSTKSRVPEMKQTRKDNQW
jgi:IS5 family transposase